jgi:hypothetical protein
MHSVPVWLLTAVIEVSLLAMATLSTLLWLVWRRQRRLTLQVTELQRALMVPSTVAAIPTEWPAETGVEEELDMASVAAGCAVTEGLLEELSPAAPVAHTYSTEVTAEVELSEPEQALLPATETDETLAEDPSDAANAAEALPVPITQEMLDNLFTAAAADEDKDAVEMQEDNASEIQRSVVALLSENADMEQRIGELQAKGLMLREAIEALQANAALPPEEQQNLPVPEAIMQEMEQGLAALQLGCERMQHELRAHCQALGLAELEEAAVSGASGDQEASEVRLSAAVLQEEVVNLKAVLEQRAVEFQRVQEEYSSLLEEYQRIFKR